MNGGECGVESGHEGVRRGITRDRLHHLSHSVTNINIDAGPNLLIYHEVEVLFDAEVRLRRHEFLRGRARVTRGERQNMNSLLGTCR